MIELLELLRQHEGKTLKFKRDLSFEDIRRGISKLRNRVIGRVFHELKLIEQWGSGVQRMISACRQAEKVITD